MLLGDKLVVSSATVRPSIAGTIRSSEDAGRFARRYSTSEAAASATSACTATGVQNTAVLLVTFPGVTLPSTLTTQTLNDVFFGTTGRSVTGYLQETSYGQTSASGAAFGPYTLTGTYTACTDVSGSVLNDAVAAATASGVNLNNYNRIFLVFPDVLGCGWSGFATVGGCSLTTSSGTFNASTAYMTTGSVSSVDTGVEVAAHELGHNFGLGHAQLRSYSSEPLGSFTDTGTITEYGDHFSVMSASNLGHYAAPQKQMLGWLPAAEYQTVTTSGTYTILPLETDQAGIKALQAQRGTGNSGYYLWIEYRQPLGNYDSTLSSINSQVFGGATIHYQDSSTSNRTQLLDYTAPDTYYNDPDLFAGSTWSDPYSNISVNVQSATSSGLTVNINYGAMPCTHSNPTVAVSPSNPSAGPGQSVSYAASVTNNDTAGCTASTFGLGSNVPSGWSGTLSTAALTISPGQSGTATLAVTAPSGTTPGTYPVSTAAANGSYVGTGTANLTVATATVLLDSLSLPTSSYARGNTVSMTATVLTGSTAVPNASVAFTLNRPNGTKVSGKATTGLCIEGSAKTILGHDVPKPITAPGCGRERNTHDPKKQ